MRANGSRTDRDARDCREDGRSDEETCRCSEVVGWRRRGIETLRERLGGLDWPGLVEADLCGRASGGTEPGDLRFHGKQRRQDREQDAQRRESRMPDQEASPHVQQSIIRTFLGKETAGLEWLRIALPWREEVGAKRLCHCRVTAGDEIRHFADRDYIRSA